MNEKHTGSREFRLIFGLMLVGAAALLIGAGRFGDSMLTRKSELDAAKTQWRTAARLLCQPEKELRSLSLSHPEYVLQTLRTGMRPETQN